MCLTWPEGRCMTGGGNGASACTGSWTATHTLACGWLSCEVEALGVCGQALYYHVCSLDTDTFGVPFAIDT